MERKVSVQADLLEKSLVASSRLRLGIDSIAAPKYRPGTTVIEAYEIELQKNTKGVTTNSLKKEDLRLTNFPRGTSSYEAKMVEKKMIKASLTRLRQKI